MLSAEGSTASPALLRFRKINGRTLKGKKPLSAVPQRVVFKYTMDLL